MNTREKATKIIKIGDVSIGGGHPVAIQSMTNTRTTDIDKTIDQILRLEHAGCEIVRISVPDMDSAAALAEIKPKINIPVVADVHFKAELAVAAIDAGVDKIRINPGNIGDVESIRKVVKAARKAGIPIRIGVNSGSISDEIRANESPMAQKMVQSALQNIKIIEAFDFNEIVVSVKSPDVNETVEACRQLAGQIDYPFHIGVTESGTLQTGAIKSAAAIGILLADSIGDTIRVSLAADPVDEVIVARKLLQALDLRRFFPEVIACPTCARCEVDLIPIAEQLEDHLADSKQPIKVAIMGCVVNGPGEAADADIGLAAGRGRGVIFSKGKAVRTVDEKDFLEELIKSIEKLKSA